MSYFRASTANDQGWRPGTVTLGNMIRHAGPDWKAVAAQHAAAVRAGQQIQQARQRVATRRMSAIDAAARGDRTRVRMPRLSGLSGLDLSSLLVNGQTYIFHFTWSGLGLSPDMNAISQQIASSDSNFLNPVASAESGGVRVQFVYNGQGSNVAAAGAEMQNAINTFGLMGIANGLTFSGADGGPGGSLTAPGAPNPSNNNNNNPSSFSWSSFLAGMGLSVGVGTALAVGLGVVLLRD